MSFTETAENRPAQVDPMVEGARRALGPGYDWLIELLRQIGRPLAFAMCIFAGFYQILAPPEARLDDFSAGGFGVGVGDWRIWHGIK